jgi:glycine oxidase
MQQKHFDVLIIGAGIIGCSTAYYAARAGLRTLVIERGEIAGEASLAGAGMLTPVAETRDQPADLPDTHPARAYQLLCLAALRCYDGLDLQLKEETGLDIGLVRRPTMRLAVSEEEEETLHGELARQKMLLPGQEWLDAKSAREEEPLLASQPELRGASISLYEPNVSSPQLARAFAAGATVHGASILTGCTVGNLLLEHGRVVGVKTDQGPFYAAHVVLAAGAWAARWHVPTATPPIYPLKGQALSLLPAGELPLRHTISQASGCYLVPKADGSVYVGATVENAGFDKAPTAEGVASLLGRAGRTLPALLKARFRHVLVGLRPGSADDLPLLGETASRPRLVLAGGHYRTGILLSPLTGLIIASELQGKPVPYDLDLRAFDPDRFGGWDGSRAE